MFRLSDIVVRHGPVVAVALREWEARAGEHWLLAGPSGSGKSTLLNLLAGLAVATEGQVVVAGTDLGTLDGTARDRWRGRTVGIVPQRLHLVGALDVADNLRIAQRLAGLAVDESRVRSLLEAVAVADLARRLPRALSQGEAQRVAIARAVVNRPVLLLADEPTANLDDAHAAAALELLRTQALESGATLVVASHDARVKSLLPHVCALPGRAT